MRHMSRFIPVAIMLGFALMAAPFAHGVISKSRTVTVTGTLIDTKCYSMDTKNKFADHVTPRGEMKGCAALCANLGIPVAVLTRRGEVWTLVTPSRDLADHMAKSTRVTGVKVYGSNQIRPDKIEVQDPNGVWSEVKITMPMPM